MSATEDLGREVDTALEEFTDAQVVMLRAGRRLINARARFTETAQLATLATVTELRRVHD